MSICNSLGMYLLKRVEVRHFLSLWWLVVLISPGSLAESRLNFPRLSNEPGTITGVAIVNPRDEAATITVTAYLEDGEVLAGAGIQNPVEMVIEGNQQLALLTSDFFGSALPESTVGWFSVTSETNYLYEIETRVTTLMGVVREAAEDLLRSSPQLDFDASHAVFSSREDLTGLNPRGDEVLFVFKRTGQTLEQVTGQLGKSDVAGLSVDGRLLSMASNKNPVKLNRDTNREIFLLDLLAGKVFQVTRSLEVLNQLPSFSAAGTLLAFRSTGNFQDQNADGNFEIYLANCSDVVD